MRAGTSGITGIPLRMLTTAAVPIAIPAPSPVPRSRAITLLGNTIALGYKLALKATVDLCGQHGCARAGNRTPLPGLSWQSGVFSGHASDGELDVGALFDLGDDAVTDPDDAVGDVNHLV